MIYGAKNGLNTGIRYDQTNNIMERFLEDMKAAGESRFWLESCNVCALGCGVEAVSGLWRSKVPQIRGIDVFGQDDLMFMFLYSTDGRKRLPKLALGIKENEVAENLVFAVNECSTAKAALKEISDMKTYTSEMKAALSRGSAIALSYMTDYGSGHYICVVGFDGEKGVFIAYDSWAANMHCKRGGVKEEYNSAFFESRARPRFIEIHL